MKKVGVLIVFLLVVFVLSGVFAQNGLGEFGDSLEDLEEKKEQVEDLSAEDVRNEYLKQEWGEILKNNTYTGPVVRLYEKSSPVVDPVVKYTIGAEPEFNWVFVLTLVLWVTFIIYLYNALSGFSTFSDTTSFVISVALAVAGANFGWWVALSNLIINFISLFAIWWVQLILVVAVVAGLIIANAFSKHLKLLLVAWKLKRAKQQEKENRQRLKQTVGFFEKIARIFTKSLGEGEK